MQTLSLLFIICFCSRGGRKDIVEEVRKDTTEAISSRLKVTPFRSDNDCLRAIWREGYGIRYKVHLSLTSKFQLIGSMDLSIYATHDINYVICMSNHLSAFLQFKPNHTSINVPAFALRFVNGKYCLT